MATSGSLELGDYKPVQEQPRQQTSVTYWDLVIRATKAKVNSNIQVMKLPIAQKEIDDFIDEQEISVVHSERPKEVSRVLVDINVKEYENHGGKENDETMVKIEKTTAKKHGRRYNFSTTSGVNYGVSGNIGAKKIIELGLGGSYSKSKEKTNEKESSFTDELVFGYNQEEKIVIPPGKRAEVKVETSTVKYQQKYTLKYKIAGSRSIAVTYKDLGCCGLRSCFCGSSRCYVSAQEILRTLQDFKEESGYVSYTQEGVLEWVGEGCSVTKTEFPLM